MTQSIITATTHAGQQHSAFNVSPETNDFLSCVVNPLDNTQPGRVPDLFSGSTVCLTDWVEANVILNRSVLTPAAGALIIAIHGSSELAALFEGITFEDYKIVVMTMDSSGTVSTDSYETMNPSNQGFINGSGAATRPTDTTSFVSQYRLFAYGVRILPTIETVTDSSIPYMSSISGGALTATSLSRGIQDGLNMFQEVRNSRGARTFGNNQGCCVRYDPFQTEDQLEMRSVEHMYDTFRTNNTENLYFPCIAIRFSQTIAQNAPMPFLLNGRWWMEAMVKQPTPIYSDRSPRDMDYPRVRVMLSGGCPTHPLVVKGHSFKSFMQGASGFVRDLAHLIDETSIIGTAIGKSVKGIFSKKKKRKRKNKRGGGKGGARKGGGLPGRGGQGKAAGPARQIPRRR